MSNHQFNQPIEHAGNMVQDRVSIHIENMLRGTRATSPEPSIFRVPHHLREINEKAYEPMFLAIGPYHHGNDKLKYKDLKPRYLQQLRNREEWSYDRYLPTLRELEQRARNYYAETIDLSQEEFLAMMLIDGCFIVELFRRCKISTNENDSLMDPTWLRCDLRRDLLLLENQLPFFVLSKLYDLTEGPYEQHKFDVVAIEFFKREGDFDPNWTNWTRGNWVHLLHLYYAWCGHGSPEKPLLPRTVNMPSAIELKKSGVRFRAVKGRRLGDIKFENGTLEIPVLILEDNTESEFRNLIAYEQHDLRRTSDYFTAYSIFMYHLINSSKDVKLLRLEGIIDNCLGDDEVVAQMFNKMCYNIVSTGTSYSEIFGNLNAYRKKRRNVWMARLRREYFHSPWGLLSVVAAIVLLLLTAAQTIYAILSYKKHP